MSAHRGLPLNAVLSRPRSGARLWRRCVAGNEPAEALPTRDREDLIWHPVHDLGWTDREVAEHTRMTEYTTARIRNHLGLPPSGVALNDNTLVVACMGTAVWQAINREAESA
jgi:hypothetical protein